MDRHRLTAAALALFAAIPAACDRADPVASRSGSETAPARPPAPPPPVADAGPPTTCTRGEVICRVGRVRRAGATWVSKVTCAPASGSDDEGPEVPIAGIWRATRSRAWRGAGDVDEGEHFRIVSPPRAVDARVHDEEDEIADVVFDRCDELLEAAECSRLWCAGYHENIDGSQLTDTLCLAPGPDRPGIAHAFRVNATDDHDGDLVIHDARRLERGAVRRRSGLPASYGELFVAGNQLAFSVERCFTPGADD